MTKDKRQKNKEFFSCDFLKKNRRGWIRIVEAFAAIMLLAGVLLIIISNSRANIYDLSNQIYDVEAGILMKIYTDDSQREIILNIRDSDLDLKWDEFTITNGMNAVRNKIESETPGFLECNAKLCSITDACALDSADSPSDEKSIYVSSAIVTANINVYAPRKLNLFCWEK